MDKLKITANGPLNGEITVSGAKNAALLALRILGASDETLRNRLAAYQDEVPTELPGGWEYMTFWQRSDSGNVNGITGNTDMNLFNGSEAELDSLGTGNQVKLGKVLTPNFKASDALGSSNLGALSRNNGEIVGIILALALGAVSIGALNDAATP